MTILEYVKNGIPITSTAYDDFLTMQIEAAQTDLGIAGVANVDNTDPIVIAAITTFCKLRMPSAVSDPAAYQRLKESYDEQKAQLSTATGYTDWSVMGNA